MDSYTSKVDDVVKVCEEKFPREPFVFRNREVIPTPTTCNSIKTNLAQGSNDLDCEKWSDYIYQVRLKKPPAMLPFIFSNSIRVIPVTDGNDSNDVDATSEINALDSIDTSINSKTLDEIESSNHINNSSDNDWDFMDEELEELELEDKNPKSNEQVKL